MMKSLLAGVLVLAMSAGLVFGGLLSEDPGELVVGGQLWFPGEGDDDLFDLGFGAFVSYREWIAFPWGVGLNLGIAQYDVDKKATSYKWKGLTDYHGDANVLFLGPAVYFNIVDWDSWNLTFETGLQYVHADSDVRVKHEGETMKVKMKGGLLWHLGLEYEYMVAETAYLLAGAGYQIDTIPIKTDYTMGKLRDTYLHGAFVRLGVKFLF